MVLLAFTSLQGYADRRDVRASALPGLGVSGPSVNRAVRTTDDAGLRENLVRNSSVEADLEGWVPFTSDLNLEVAYDRDSDVSFHGRASLRQEISSWTGLTSTAAAYWVYPVAVDPSWWGKPV